MGDEDRSASDHRICHGNELYPREHVQKRCGDTRIALLDDEVA